MTQASLVVANGGGSAVRAAINSALMALATLNIGPTAPNPTYPGMFWGDTGSGTLWRRKSDNSAWVSMGQLDAALSTQFASLAGSTSQVFSVANATQSQHALPLGQANGLYAKLNNGGSSSANLIPNSSAELGNQYWSSTPATPVSGTNDEGTYWSMPTTATATTVVQTSNFIPIAGGATLYLQAEMFAGGVTSGGFSCDITFYTSAQVLISYQNATLTATNGTGWTWYSNSCTAPANAAFAVIRFYFSGAVSSNAAIRRIKMSQAMSPYSQEATIYVLGQSIGGGAGIFSINTGTVSGNALTVGYPAQTIAFRSSTLTSGTPSVISATAGSLAIPAGATLGTVSGQQSTIVLLALNNGGVVEPAVVNLAGGVDLSEAGFISTTAISAGATAANVVYSAAAQTNVPYRVVGAYYVTEATAGTWATAPSKAVGAGGQAFTTLMSIGYGQTWQTVTRTSGTTYYNTTPRPIAVCMSWDNTSGATAYVNGALVVQGSLSSSNSVSATFIVPPGQSYVMTAGAGFTNISELR